MYEDVKEILNQYRVCTLSIMKTIEEEELDLLPPMLEERQNLLDKISDSDYDNDDVRLYYNELRLEELQENLNFMISGKLSFIRDEIAKLNKSQNANNSYNKVNFGGAKIFSKKI